MRTPQSMLASVVILSACATFSRATTTTIALYHLGEDDPGAGPALLANDPTLDHGGGKLDLSRFGSPHYSADVAPGATASSGSTLSMQFSPKTLDAYYRLAPVTTLTDNVGIEAWVKTVADPAASGTGVIAYDGTPGADGLGLLRVADATPFGSLAPVYVGRLGNTTVGFSALPAGEWVHLALVRSGGTATFYVNGQAAGTSAAALDAATQTFTVGASYCAVCDRPIPTADYLNGLVDDVRVFSFAPGQFNAFADLSYRSVPEPALVTVLTAPFLLARRRGKSKIA